MAKLFTYLNVKLSIKEIAALTNIPAQTLYYQSKGTEKEFTDYITNRIDRSKREALKVSLDIKKLPTPWIKRKINYFKYFIYTTGILTLLYILSWTKN